MTHARYRKKPIVVEAVQFLGTLESVQEVAAFFEGYPHRWKSPRHLDGGFIATLEGEMEFVPTDWIIRGVKRECYPCKPDIFAATYESAEIEVATTHSP